MICIYFNQPFYEYDLHSLVKAFFPREEVEMYYTFAAEDADAERLAVKHFAPGYRRLREDDAARIAQNISAAPETPGEIMQEGMFITDGSDGNLQDVKTAEAIQNENAVKNTQTASTAAEIAGSKNPADQIIEIFYADTADSTDIAWYDGVQIRKTSFAADLTDKREGKNAAKRGLYHLLSEGTGQQLPWGALTGIRPTKLAMKRLEEGHSEEEAVQWMQDNYLASEHKARLAVEIAQREKRLLSDIDYEHNCSLYVGIPFCPTTCLYCSFTSYPISAWRGQVDAYLDAVEKELDFTAERCRDKKMNTVYIGGGTPTTLEPDQMERLIRMIRERFDLSICREFTVEAGRPDSITAEKLLAMHENGIDRISVNPQTMKQETLDLIGRRHTVEQTIEGFSLAREVGFTNINMDLIMGLPKENLEDVRHTMEQIAAMGPESVTVHSLAIKRAARLSAQWEMYRDVEMVNTQGHMDVCETYCRQMGLSPYYLYRQKGMAGNLENVGYAAEGCEGLYNILMMEEKQSIMAIGAGASTKLVLDAYNADGSRVIRRVENVKDIRSYLERTDEMIERKAKRMDEVVASW